MPGEDRRPLLRLLPDIRYGTERYTETIARRLRAVNITMWSVASVVAGFALVRFFDPAPRGRRIALVNLLAALIFAALPLLHRFGPLAAPLAFIAFSYAFIFRVCSVIGTGGGAYLYYLTAAALGVLFIGTERAALAAALTAVAAGLIVTVHAVLPHSTGFLTDFELFYTSFTVNVAASAAILFTVVYYAVRAIARAEAAAEREFARSESLLANILPPRIAARLKDRGGADLAESYPEASILFADMQGFTALASGTAPTELVRFLNAVFTRLDTLVERHGLEKIKTTGDSYMVVSGVPVPRADHAEALADLALDMHDALAGLTDPKGRSVPASGSPRGRSWPAWSAPGSSSTTSGATR